MSLPLSDDDAAAYERELVDKLSHLRGTDLEQFGVELVDVRLDGSFPKTTLVLEYVDRRSGDNRRLYPIRLWRPALAFEDPDGLPADPGAAAAEIYASLIEG